MKKKLLSLSALLCAGAMCLPLAACGDGGKADAAAFVSMDINPSVEFTLDKNNKVISVYGANEDAQVLLYNESGIVGADIEVAVEKVTSLAVELGYLDGENKVVQTSVTASGGKSDGLLAKVNAKVTATAGALDLSVSCDGEQAYSLVRKLENLKAKYPQNSAVQALTPERAKLVFSATATGEISVEAAVELDDKALLEYVSQMHAQTKEYATTAYNKAKAAADTVYDKAVSATLDGVYTTYYMKHHMDKAYYAFAYQGYKTSASAMRVLSKTLYYAEQVGDYELSEKQVASIVTALGLDSAEALKDSDGKVTIKSIEAYADKQFKNSEASAQLETLKEQLTTALNGVESEVQAVVDELSVQHETELNAVKNTVDGIAESIKGLEVLVPASVKEQLGVMVGDFKDISSEVTGIVSDGKITADEVRAIAGTLDKKSADMLGRIENDLTDEEKAEVKDLQEKAAQQLAKAKAQYDGALAQAETSAKERLEQLKAARKKNA